MEVVEAEAEAEVVAVAVAEEVLLLQRIPRK
jgi:hypothetical protein